MSKGPQRSGAPSECPVCGARVPPGARACPECGADERTGWDEEKTRDDGLDLPGGSFDYEEALKDERLRTRHVPKGVPVLWWLVGIGLLLILIVSLVVYGHLI